MQQIATIVPLTNASPTVESATVTGLGDVAGYLSVRLNGDTTDRIARMAVYPTPQLTPGDDVLVTTDTTGLSYIIGILSCRRSNCRRADRLRLADGTEARIDRSSQKESIKLYSNDDRLLVEYHSGSGTMTISAPSGDIKFTAEHGGIDFKSAKDIRIDGSHVVLNAERNIRLGVQAANGGAGPTVSLNNRSLKLAAPLLDFIAPRAHLFFEETQIAGKKLLGRITNVQLIARKIESVAETVMAKAKNVYRTIAELSQLKAGRQRTLIDKTIHTKAQKTVLKSEQDFKVKAEKIHLG